MPLISSALASDMKDATKNAKDSSEGLKKLGDAIGDYVSDNAMVIFAWVGIMPPSIPDPQVVAKGKISGFKPSLTESKADSQSSALTKLASELKTAMMSAKAEMPEGFSTSPSPMASAPSVSSLNLNISGDDRDGAFDQLASQICDWIKGCTPTAPSAGSHAAFTGSGTVTKIL